MAGRLKSAFWELAVAVAFLVAILLGCLVLLGKFIRGARWFGIADFTFVYLVGSILIASSEILVTALLLRKENSSRRLAIWLTGITCVWIPVSAAIALDVLFNTLPKWLPLSFLGCLLLVLLYALWFHRDLLKRVFRGNDAEWMEQAAASKSGVAIEWAFYAAFAGACCVLLVSEPARRAAVDAALVQLASDVDQADALLKEPAAKPADAAMVPVIAVHRQVVDQLAKLGDQRLSREQTETLAALMIRTRDQQSQVTERLNNAREDLEKKAGRKGKASTRP